MIYYCNECEKYFNDESIVNVAPDGGSMHDGCMDENYNELTLNEIVEALNDKEIR